MLIHGDCKIELKKIDLSSIDLIYLDPPFFTQKKHVLKDKNHKQYSFEDRWENIHIYKNYIQERLRECERLLKPSGSLFLHCDSSASHHLRIALDEVFGEDNFQSEIIWSYKRWSNAKKGLLNAHQVIFFYSKTKNFKFNSIYTDYSPTTNLDQIFQKRARSKEGKTVYKISKTGQTEFIKEKRGVPLSDVWEIPYLNPKAKERAGYPTQKPILLLERIIKLTTHQGDTVLDPFCGSGTALVSAKLLKRKYIGIDKSEEAVQLSRERLENPVKTESNLLKKGKKAYINQDDKTLDILNKLNAAPVHRNKGIDGFLKIKGWLKPIPVRIQKEAEALECAIQLLERACQKNAYQKKVLIKTNQGLEDQFFIFNQCKEDKNMIIIEDIDNFDQQSFVQNFSSKFQQ